MKKTKHICLVTAGHLCNCPRLIKEARTFINLSYTVTIIATQYLSELIEQDSILLKQNPKWNFICINWTLRDYRYLFNVILQKGLRFTNKAMHHHYLDCISLNLNYKAQFEQAMQINADLYIGHGIGGLTVAGNAAISKKSLFGFDAEDYHLGEGLEASRLASIARIEKHLLDQATYISASSPEISSLFAKSYSKPTHLIIYNVFENTDFKNQPSQPAKPLRLFWFSQTIGKGRGLEELFIALSEFSSNEVNLTLIGRLTAEDELFFTRLIREYELADGIINFHAPLPQNELHEFAQQFDVGISLEKSDPLNRDLCLTNKLFVYLQAGLNIIGSKTTAQLNFASLNPINVNFVALENPESIIITLKKLIQNVDISFQNKKLNYELGQKSLNWHTEQNKLIRLINSIF